MTGKTAFLQLRKELADIFNVQGRYPMMIYGYPAMAEALELAYKRVELDILQAMSVSPEQLGMGVSTCTAASITKSLSTEKLSEITDMVKEMNNKYLQPLISAQMNIITSQYSVTMKQFRFPQSKKKRIRRKWAKDMRNFKSMPAMFMVNIPATKFGPMELGGMQGMYMHPDMKGLLDHAIKMENIGVSK